MCNTFHSSLISTICSMALFQINLWLANLFYRIDAIIVIVCVAKVILININLDICYIKVLVVVFTLVIYIVCSLSEVNHYFKVCSASNS